MSPTKRYVSILLLLLFLAPPIGSRTAPTLAASPVAALTAEVARAAQHNGALGVHVVEIDTGETVYAYNADEQLILASNQKLFTTAAALDALGPGYFFETRLVFR
ncbi:MAG TPA: D-alanyl-D-alanine carboxypeptidase, partial [Thermoanaerobaculia bacterium]|nr:D-alanyl-D-alanine carboxypeptidase [Thermoanaerobaculia bacterium]